jgi:cell wall-associated NlpC family hydrolase
MMAERFAQAVRGYIGTPWVHQGRRKGLGVDCVGVVMCATQEVGIAMRDVANYPTQTNRTWMLDELRQQCVQVELHAMQVGDLLSFAWGANPWHIGVVTSVTPLKVVHAWRQVDRVVEMRLDNAWRRRICGVWRFPEACE